MACMLGVCTDSLGLRDSEAGSVQGSHPECSRKGCSYLAISRFRFGFLTVSILSSRHSNYLAIQQEL